MASKQKQIAGACPDKEEWREEDCSSDSESEGKTKDAFQGIKDKMDNSSDSESDDCEPKAPECDPTPPKCETRPVWVSDQISETPGVSNAKVGASMPSSTKQRSLKTKAKQESGEKKLKKILNVELVASPEEVAADLSLAVWSLNEGVGHKFQREKRTRVNHKVVTEKVGNHKKATIHSLKAKSGQNLYGFTIGVVIPGIEGTHLSKDGKSALITIKPGESLSFESGQLMHVNESAEDPHMKKFSNLSHEQIENQYQKTLGSKKTYDVLVNSEIAQAVMNPRNKQLHEKYKDLDASKEVVQMECQDVDTIVTQLKNLVGDLPVKNLEDFAVELVRMDGKAWNDTDKVVGMMNSKNEREAAMYLNRNSMFSIDLELEYTLPEN